MKFKKKFPQAGIHYTLLGLILLSSLLLSFKISFYDTRSPNNRIFNLQRTLTWRVTEPFIGGLEEGIARILAIEDLDNKVLSNDIWQDFTLSFDVSNPYKFSFLFDYKDNSNYNFCYFNAEQKNLIWGMVKEKELIQRDLENPDFHGPLRLNFIRGDGKISLYNNGALISEKNFEQTPGRFGFVLPEVKKLRTEFSHIQVAGRTDGHKSLKVNYLNPGALNVPRAFFFLYCSLIGAAVYLIFTIEDSRNKSFAFLQKPFLRLRDLWVARGADQKVYCVTAFLAGSVVFSRAIQSFLLIIKSRLKDVDTWEKFSLSLLIYGFFLAVAFLYSRKKIIPLSTPLVLIGLFFFLYVLNLINSLTLHASDRIFNLICMAGLLASLMVSFLKHRTYVKSPLPYVTLNILLIWIWFFYAVFYFFHFDFTPYRQAHTDENFLWYVAARNILELGFTQAHFTPYPAGILHSLGIPFTAALPSLLLGYGASNMVFFMPIIVIAGFALFLDLIKEKPWCFLFFYVGMYAALTFNWLGHLTYRTLNGEGLGMLFFLFIVYELHKFSEKKEIFLKEFLILSGCIGLVSVCKTPLGYFNWLFMLILSVLFIRSKKEPFKAFLWVLAGMTLSLLTLVVWKVFNAVNNYEINALALSMKKGHYLTLNKEMLALVFGYLKAEYLDAIYLTGLAAVFVFISPGKGLRLLMAPSLAVIFFVLYFYGFIFDGVDNESSVRYLSTQMLGTFYLGGMALQQIIGHIEDSKLNQHIKSAAYFFFSVLIMAVFI